MQIQFEIKTIRDTVSGSHSLFWARVLSDIPALAKYRFPIVINEAEPAVHLAVKAHAPNLIQFEGWVHRFKDMDRYMRQKGYGAHAVGYFKAKSLFLFSFLEDISGLCQISADVRVSRGYGR